METIAAIRRILWVLFHAARSQIWVALPVFFRSLMSVFLSVQTIPFEQKSLQATQNDLV